MKRVLFFAAIVSVVVLLLSSCSTQRDCQGVKHYKQKGGFYM